MYMETETNCTHTYNKQINFVRVYMQNREADSSAAVCSCT